MNRSSLARRPLIGLIGVYRRWVSPVLPAHCRFYPSCSEYAADALGTHGVRRGGWMALRRIASCHPFHPGGFDPVPPPLDSSVGTDAR